MLPLLTGLPAIGPGPHPAPGPLDVHIWHHEQGTRLGPERTTALLALLSAEERARSAALRDDRRRQQFVVGRALLRRVLSVYAPVPPEQWQFALGGRDKPYVVAPKLDAPLWFNLSHAGGVSMCAVTGAGPGIGVDVEQVEVGRDALSIAEQFFPDIEVNALRRVPPSQRDEAFVRLWALKESFAKASGTSLTDGISSTAFDITRPDDIRIAFHPPLDHPAHDWHFKLLRLDQTRIVAVALGGTGAGPISISIGTSVW